MESLAGRILLGLWSGGWAGRRRCNERMFWSVQEVCLGLGVVEGGMERGVGAKS